MQSLEDWHKMMGHCNADDILKLEEYVEGMQITDRNNFNVKLAHERRYHSHEIGCPTHVRLKY